MSGIPRRTHPLRKDPCTVKGPFFDNVSTKLYTRNRQRGQRLYTHELLQQGVEVFVDVCKGDRFKACNLIAHTADKLLKLTQNSVSESEAVSWATTGVAPDNLQDRRRQHMLLSAPKTKYMTNLLSYVDDTNVRQAVEESFSQSVRLGSLTFYYPTKLSPSQKQRVRVLTRMCWHNQ